MADRVLGMERTVLYGGVVVMCGHIALALLPGLTGVAVGLVLIALGSGALKANASSLLGTLYAEGDPRRDGGFTLFYLGINLGAFIGPLITGLLQTHLGFHYGFGAAAIGMALGLAQYVAFRRNLGEHGRTVPHPLSGREFWRMAVAAAVVVAVVVIAFLVGVIKLANLSPGDHRDHRRRIDRLLRRHAEQSQGRRARAHTGARLHSAVHRQRRVLVAVPADLHRAGGLLHERMNWSIFGWTAPSNWIGSIEPVWIILLSPCSR